MSSNTVADTVSILFDCRPHELEIEKLIGGETNRNYKVRHNGSLTVVRLPYEGAELVDRGIEYANIDALLKNPHVLPVVPKYHVYVLNGRNAINVSDPRHLDLPNGTAVTEYIDGTNLSTSLLGDEEVQRELVRTLHRFHNSGVRFVNRYDPFQDEIQRYKKQAEGSGNVAGVVDSATLAEFDELARQLEGRLNGSHEVSTHNDLIYSNLIAGTDGGIYLLDFEYAGLNVNGGLHYDFGTLFGENLFWDDPITRELYEKILGIASRTYGTEFIPEKAYAGAAVNMLVTFWWGMVKLLNSSTEEERKYFADYVFRRTQKIKDIGGTIKF